MLKRLEVQMTTEARFSTRPGLAIRNVPVATVARFGLALYVAQAVAGLAFGFAVGFGVF